MNRYIHAIYCDDIRIEVGNKQSLMGIYKGSLIIPEVPVTIPKLCIWIELMTPISKPFKSLALKVLRDDDVLMEVVLPHEQLKEQKAIINNGNDEDRRIGLGFSCVLSPFVIDKPFKLRVRAQTESEELKGSALKIDVAPSEKTVSNPS